MFNSWSTWKVPRFPVQKRESECSRQGHTGRVAKPPRGGRFCCAQGGGHTSSGALFQIGCPVFYVFSVVVVLIFEGIPDF